MMRCIINVVDYLVIAVVPAVMIIIKCIELMNTQKKKRVYEWRRTSAPRKKPSTKKKDEHIWPGWSMLDEDGNNIVV
jgi:large-conductance mechanosensitive channel